MKKFIVGLKHKGQTVLTGSLSFAIISAAHIPAPDSYVFIKWKRGKKQGTTNKTTINSFGYAQWFEEFKIGVTLFKDQKSHTINPKTLHVSLYMVCFLFVFFFTSQKSI